VADFSAKDVQKLRQEAGVGMMDAKQALTDAEGDLGRAFELLRERGQAKMAKRADREANQGAIGNYVHVQNDRPVMGVLVELVCETDFVAKSDEFRQVADDIAMHASWGRPTWVTRDDVDQDALAKERDLQWVHVPFKGDGPVVNAILGGHIDVAGLFSVYKPHVSAGKLRALVSLMDTRVKAFPDVPTYKDLGFKFDTKGSVLSTAALSSRRRWTRRAWCPTSCPPPRIGVRWRRGTTTPSGW